MREYNKIISEFIEAICKYNDNKFGRTELAAIIDVAIGLVKTDLYKSIGMRVSEYSEDFNEIVSKFNAAQISGNAVVGLFSTLMERIIETEGLDNSDFLTTMNYIKMMIEW